MFEQMKGLTPKKKVQHFVEYYGVITVVIIVAAVFAISLIRNFVTAKAPVAGIIAVNSAGAETGREPQVEDYLNSLMEEFGYDTDREEITVDSAFYLGGNTDANAANQSMLKMQTMLASHSADVLLFDRDAAETILNFGALAEVSQFLPKDYGTEQKDNFLYYTDPETQKTYPVAVRVNPDSRFLELSGMFTGKDAYIGICIARVSEDDSLYQRLIQDCLEE